MDDARRELEKSKQKIEEKLGIECVYFSAPWGKPGDLDISLHSHMVKDAGFRCHLTSIRGTNQEKTNPFMIKRDFISAGWQNNQLRYLFSGV